MSLPEAYQMALLKIIQQKLREAKSSEEAESILNLDAGGGYCYLRLFADEHQLDAQELGAHPSVAELRRFANSRAQPFGRKKVVVGMGNVMGEVVAHVEYSDGKRAISPAAVLAGLSKQVFVGSGALKGDPLQVRLMQTISDFYAETGARKPKSVEDADKEKEGGYCYLRLFDERHKRDAAACGSLPSAADVRRFANARAAPYGPHRVKVALVEVQGHTVAHVEYSEDVDSLTPLAALSALNKDVLVGMAEVSVVRRSDSTDVATGIGSTMEITPRSNHCRVDLPIGGYLNSTEKDAMTFFPGDIAGFRRAFQLFESVRLIKFSMTATVQGDHSTVLRLAVTANRNPPSNNAGWAAAEGSMTMVGNSNGATVSEFSLPENHQFGRELKGMPMSNLPPTFHFYVTSGGPCHVWFRGTFTLDMSGQGNPSGVNMAGHSYKMQRVFPAHTLTGLGDKEGGPGEETDDDDDDHPDLFKHAKQVSGPVKAGNSGRSSVSPTASRVVQK